MRFSGIQGSAFAVLVGVGLAVSGGESAAQTAGPPFRPGEVAIYAPPEALAGERVIEYYPHAGISVIRVAQGHEAPRVDFYRRLGRRAGLNRIVEAFGTVNDTHRGLQWNFDHVQANDAWDSSTGGGVTVAVVDTGVSSGPLDGIGCLLASRGWNSFDGSNNAADDHGHGTHVAGTVAQNTDNARGVAGLAHGSCILPVKVLSASGSGSSATLADGIAYVVNAGGAPRASVINMSLGYSAGSGKTTDALIDPQLDAAAAAGITVVAASGNDNNSANVSYPAIYPTVMAVGATDYANQLAPYSNRGTGIEIVAPGGDTRSDRDGNGDPDGVLQETNYGGSWAYRYFQGTSMASPHVAAAAALVRAAKPGATEAEVREALTASALDLGSSGFDSSFGHGLLQAADAITFALGGGGGGGGGGGSVDQDGDGYTVGDGDCDDTNRRIYPGHPDQKGRWGRDGLDNDCNGIIDG